MVLKCPHCTTKIACTRADFIGNWVVCKRCELPFEWRAGQGRNGRGASGDAKRPDAERQWPNRR
jgi:hypothetical protein